MHLNKMGNLFCYYLISLGLVHLTVAQIDPVTVVSVIGTSIGLIKYVASLWNMAFNEKQDPSGLSLDNNNNFGFSIPGPFPDFNFENFNLNNLNSTLTNQTDWQAVMQLLLKNDKAILGHFAAMSAKLTGMDQRLQVVEMTLARLTRQFPAALRWELGLDRLLSMIRPVHSLYDTFRLYQEQKEKIERLTLEDFAQSSVGHGTDSLRSILWQIHDQTVSGAVPATDVQNFRNMRFARQTNRQGKLMNPGIFDNFHEYLKASDGTLCSLTKSPHQLVFDFYSLLALTDAKGYAMMQFSWMLLRLYGKGNFSMEADMARADFERRILEKAGAARRVLADMPNWLWKCDPSPNDHHEGQTYLQLTEVLQGYLINEVDMNNINTCRENCAAYPVATDQNCFGNGFCAEQKRCDRGRIFNCRFVEADSTVCLSASLTRRYDWVEYKSGRLLGQRNDCQGRGQSQKRVDSWWRWMFWHCSYCLCLCDQPNIESDRFISLRALTSDIAQNRLITGVRFVKTGRVVSLQIQDGVALPRGGVNASTVDWRPLAPFRVTDTLPEHHNSSADYAMITWENRAIDLDDLNVPENHVITGVRFRKLGSHLNLEVQATPIDFVTGTLDNERSQWIGNDNTPESNTPRAKLGFTDPDISIRSSVPSMVDSKPDQYVEFQASSIEKDVGQTTVPFFDAQPVVPEPPTWLTGMGLFHKGQPGYGGFLSLKVATLNVTNYLALPSMPGAMN